MITKKTRQKVANGYNIPFLWKKALIGRIKILGDYGIIGSAILVADQVPGRLHQSIAQKITSTTPGKEEGLDVVNTIIICDFQYDKNFEDEQACMRYSFAESYNVPCLRVLKSLHFEDGEPPLHLNSRGIENSVALLWHKHKYEASSKQ